MSAPTITTPLNLEEVHDGIHCVSCGVQAVFDGGPVPIETEGKCLSCYHMERVDLFTTNTPLMSQLKDAPPASPLIKGVLDKGSVNMLVGPSGVGKTFISLDMAFSVAHGIPFMDRETPQSRVVYAGNEGVQNIYKRLKGLGLSKGDHLKKFRGNIEPAVWGMDEDAFRFYFPDNPLWDGKEGEPTAEFWKLIEFALVQRAELVVLDTFSSLFGGIAENANDQVALAINLLNTIRRVHNLTFLVLHHTPKGGKGARGAGVFKDNTDATLIIEEKVGQGVSINTYAPYGKVKDIAEWEIMVNLTEYAIGYNKETGYDESTLIVEPADATAQQGALAERVFAALPRDHETAIGITALKENLGVEHEAEVKRVRTALKLLVAQGRVLEEKVSARRTEWKKAPPKTGKRGLRNAPKPVEVEVEDTHEDDE